MIKANLGPDRYSEGEMRQPTRYEFRVCTVALLAYGLLAALVHAVPPPVVSAADLGVKAVAAVPARLAPAPLGPPGFVPQVATEVEPISVLARTVALTFDDGPDPRYTPQVLELLLRHRAVAMFCVVGEKAAQYPELIAAIVAAGMRLCDHSNTHDIDRASPESSMAQAELMAMSGTEVTWYRAPGGAWSRAVQSAAGSLGMRPLGWSVDPRDWTRPGAGVIVQRVLRQLHPGAVVLLHDGGGRREQTVTALRLLLPWLARHCYVTTFPDWTAGGSGGSHPARGAASASGANRPR